MKKLILTTLLAAGTLFAGVAEAEAEAGKCRSQASCKSACCKAHVCCRPFARIFPGRVKMKTEKVDTECFYRHECVHGCWKKVRYVKTTYRDIYCNGKSRYWTVVARG